MSFDFVLFRVLHRSEPEFTNMTSTLILSTHSTPRICIQIFYRCCAHSCGYVIKALLPLQPRAGLEKSLRTRESNGGSEQMSWQIHYNVYLLLKLISNILFQIEYTDDCLWGTERVGHTLFKKNWFNRSQKFVDSSHLTSLAIVYDCWVGLDIIPSINSLMNTTTLEWTFMVW